MNVPGPAEFRDRPPWPERERVHGEAAENPGFGASVREPVPEMMIVRVDDLVVRPWGYRLYVRDPQPRAWIDAEFVEQIIAVQLAAAALEWEPLIEVEFRAGEMLTLTIRAENGTWIWRFGDYDAERCLYQLAWPD